MHPAWGLGFFILVNRAVQAERRWLTALRRPRLVTAFASLGIFSYSLYLTHELVIMQSWYFTVEWLPPILKHPVDCYTRHHRVCLAVLSVLREAFSEEDRRSRRQEQEQEAPPEPRVLALKMNAESEI